MHKPILPAFLDCAKQRLPFLPRQEGLPGWDDYFKYPRSR